MKSNIKSIVESIKEEKNLTLNALKVSEPKPTWDEISTVMQNNFKSWLSAQTKKYDPQFSVTLFDELPDHIKVDFYFTLAKKFNIDNYWDLKQWKKSSSNLIMGVKELKVSEEIQDAIYDIIPITKSELLKTIKNSDKETWSAEMNTSLIDALNQEEIDAIRENRKAEKKLIKFKSRVNNIQTLEQYKLTLEDPLFDRSMFETILKRMEKQTAFKDIWFDDTSKEILKLITNHPLATTQDLIRINNMKSGAWGGSKSKIYNSNHLNTAMINKSDLPITEVMKLIKLQQYDLKVKAIAKPDLSDADKNIIIDYTLKQHFHIPSQIREIFAAGGVLELLDKPEIKLQIIESLKKKYSNDIKSSKKSNGLKFLEIINEYKFFNDLSNKDKQYISEVIASAYAEKRVTKDRIINMIDSFGYNAVDFLAILYEQTGDIDFLPKLAKDVFLF